MQPGAPRKVSPAEAFGLVISAVVLVIVTSIVGVIIDGIVVYYMWGWFISPTFDTPWLSFYAAAGISMLIRFCTYQNIPAGQREPWVTLMVTVVYPLLVLAFGYVFQLFL